MGKCAISDRASTYVPYRTYLSIISYRYFFDRRYLPLAGEGMKKEENKKKGGIKGKENEECL